MKIALIVLALAAATPVAAQMPDQTPTPVAALPPLRPVTFVSPDELDLAAIAGLAADMDLTCVVEGVETEAQLQALPAGVHAQGLLLGEPLPARATLALLLTRAGD